ncbi:hypothetical protein ES703_40900 [subsurface metagenome]
MPGEVSTIFTVIDLCLKFLGLVRKGKLKRDERQDERITILYDVLSETQSYIARLNRGDKRDRNVERNLARSWRRASLQLRPIDPEFAQICFDKGSFWTDPDYWSHEDIKKAKIGIDNVCQKAKEMLKKSAI